MGFITIPAVVSKSTGTVVKVLSTPFTIARTRAPVALTRPAT
jgi:hypothetical protein